MSAENKVPAIRFKGFSGEWGEKALDEVTNVYDGTHQTPKYTSAGVMFLSVENIKTLQSEKFISKHDFERDFKVFPQKNDVLMSRIGDVGTANVVESNTPKAYYVTLALLKHKELDPYFLKNSIASNKVKKDIWHRTLHIAFPKKINMNEICKVRIPKPESAEQTKIGYYFQQLDTLIAQHQQKHDKLLNVKKALLEKCFPQQGSTKPAIRFKGFSGEWEERNWQDTVDISTNMVDPRNEQYDELIHIGPGNIESFTGKIYNNVLSVKDSRLISGKFHFKKGDIIYGKINPQLAKYTLAPTDGLASADSYVLYTKNGLEKHYLYVILQTKNFYNYSVSVSARTGMPKINRDELNVYNFKAPKELEQTKIGQLFQQLDTLITQHQTQLKKLGNIKQACLAKMFI